MFQYNFKVIKTEQKKKKIKPSILQYMNFLNVKIFDTRNLYKIKNIRTPFLGHNYYFEDVGFLNHNHKKI